MTFIDNKYSRCYFRLMEKARGRERGPRMERHHIQPRALGGSNARDNLVRLTYREHFLAHWLLVKATEGDARRRMNFALACMIRSHSGHQRTPTSRQYEIAKRAIAGIHVGNRYAKGNKGNLGRTLSAETRAKMSHAVRNQSQETRAKRSALMMGKKIALGIKRSPETIAKLKAYQSSRSPEHQAKISAALLGNKRSLGHVTPESTKKKLSAALAGHPVSEETRAKMRAAWALRKARGTAAANV